MRRPVKTVGSVRPNFDRLKLTSKNYQKNFWNAMHYAHNELNSDKLKRETVLWAKNNDFHLAEVEALDKSHFTNVGKIFFILNEGGEITDDMLNSNKLLLERIIQDAKEVVHVEEVVPKKHVTIDRALIAAQEAYGELSAYVDDYIADEIDDINAVNIDKIFAVRGLTYEHAVYLCEFYVEDMNDYTSYINGLDSDIVEAYKDIGRKKVKRIMKYYDAVTAKCAEVYNIHVEELRANQKTPEELTKNFKYLKELPELKLYSEMPSDIVGASEVWIYNTKNRKIGVYVANDAHGLSVKSNHITNFDEELSVEKTLFKPKETIKPFKAAKSLRKMNNVFEALSTLDTKATGKITDRCIILKVG